jgi:hypothetical protein
MLLLVGLLVLTVLLIVLEVIYSNEIFGPCGFFVGVVLLIFLITIPINRQSTFASIAQFKATATSLEMARKQGNVMENAALQQKVIEQNQWLAEAQFYNSSFWSLWTPAAVNNLSPIK